ncbi:creatininase [Acuticoccus mangrovi]|uniref:Creatininase n=1 Tax=Acuticoccus mangrovi TaxID=2796142 RepID=A0A934MGI8_9HYPH|nr:creatininase [Acuticoccus mangrovi]MBJ3775975.1 creatininase [Acuticoccus mangrovi]
MTVRMADMAWPEYEKRIKAGAVVILPVGSIEQHSYHLPLGVDRYLPALVAERAAEELGAIVAEPVLYGARSQMRMGGGQTYPGTTSLSPVTLMHVIRDVLTAFIAHGAKKIVVCNGHYENMMFTFEGIDMALKDAKMLGVDDVRVMRFEYWDYMTRETIDALFPDGYPGMELEHAALIETSLMLHFRPDLVDMSKLPNESAGDFPAYDIFPATREGVPPSGALSPPNRARAEYGARIAGDCVKGIVADIRKVFGA